MSNTPIQDERFRDSGRRIILVAGRQVSAGKANLRADEMMAYAPATEQIVYRAAPGAVTKPNQHVDFDGRIYRIVAITDPHADDELMRRKFVKLIVQPV